MPEKLHEYYRPADIDSAQQILSSEDLRAEPLLLSPRPLAVEDWPMEAVVDLGLLGLDYINEENGAIRLGILTPLQTLVESPLLKNRWQGILSRAAELSGALGLRNYASLGGLLADRDAPSEVLLALLVLDARVIVRAPGGITRPVNPAEFISPASPLQRGDLPVEVHIPASAGFATLERVARTQLDLAIVAAAVWLELQNGIAKTVRVAVSGVSPLPRRLVPVEKLITGQPLTPALLEKAAALTHEMAAPGSDMRGSAIYRKGVIGTIVRRAIQNAWQLWA